MTNSIDGRIQLIRHGLGNADLEIRGKRIQLSAELMKWLFLAETGRRVEPVEFVLRFPGPDNDGELVLMASLAAPRRAS